MGSSDESVDGLAEQSASLDVTGKGPANDGKSAPRHLPVLLAETLDLWVSDPRGCYVDATLGLGGHGEALLQRCPEATLVGLDRDPRALALAAERLAIFGDRVRLVRGRFDQLSERLRDLGITAVDGILADLGVSSMQLDLAARGFSFARPGPLDMRMGLGEMTAADVVNGYPEDDLVTIFKEYGEEKKARPIARAIVRQRAEEPFETTADLCKVVESCKKAPPAWVAHRQRRGGGRQRTIHPATQVFQALRIEVNDELRQVEALLDESVQMLRQEGHLVVISYHSLEDRIVKHRLRDMARGEVEPVTGRPRAETQLIEVLTRRPVRPSDTEVVANPRSRSARLRAAKRI